MVPGRPLRGRTIQSNRRVRRIQPNVGNKIALYNFLSTFSGTHFVAPRTYQCSIGLVF